MAENLLPNEYVPFAPDDAGQIKMQHVLCESGKDHKERLYIRRMANGTVKAKCHNCGKAGVFTEPKHVRNLHTLIGKAKEEEKKTGYIKLPADCIDIRHKEDWPDKALAYLYIADLTDDEIDECGFLYSKSYNRVIIPTYLSAHLIHWQGRDIEGNMPKYITMTETGLPFKPYWLAQGASQYGDVFIVEDVLSAKRIAMCGYNAIALFGTYASTEQITNISKRHKRAIIFLDDDNATVQTEARNLNKSFNFFLQEEGFVIQAGKDPKRFGREELCTLLQSVLSAHYVGTGSTLLTGDNPVTIQRS